MKHRRKITVVTGTRAEYGILYPVMKAIEESIDLKLSIIATGMHLSSEFGHTVDEIKKDGFKIDAEVDMILSGDSQLSMVKSLGIGIMGIAQTLEVIKPDFVMVCGDRSEAFAAAVSAAYMLIPVAHLLGGDAAAGSNIDDSIRFAITKFAHIHFVATEEHAERIRKLDEESWRVRVVGSPALDTILHVKMPPSSQVLKDFSLDGENPIALVVQHPTSIYARDSKKEMRETMEALSELQLQSVVIYPNADAGGRAMIQVIREYENRHYVKLFKSLPREKYLALMTVANVMIGNSSSGIIEAPSFQLPVVNVGIRQKGRIRAENVIDVGYDRKEIRNAIEKALCDASFKRKVKNCINPYGDGRASQRIVKILQETKTTPDLLRKKITYHSTSA
jgi:UDP-N-acetylglucosamine 2-epimerase (non-hydrolysing)/GDP/UDP-N,N'-diacetylbacillosamine 2-epimerase (hydrolysing)